MSHEPPTQEHIAHLRRLLLVTLMLVSATAAVVMLVAPGRVHAASFSVGVILLIPAALAGSTLVGDRRKRRSTHSVEAESLARLTEEMRALAPGFDHFD
jgi:hypothetical protein